MYTKDEKKVLKVDFWSHLKNQMEKIKNPHGSKVNWMHYNTGFNDLYFRMEANETSAKLCIDIQFADTGVREVFWEQFEEFKEMLDGIFKGKLIWEKNYLHENGKEISRIYLEKKEVNLYNKKDWDKMHLFLKLNFSKLDHFWFEYKEVFLNLK